MHIFITVILQKLSAILSAKLNSHLLFFKYQNYNQGLSPRKFIEMAIKVSTENIWQQR